MNGSLLRQDQVDLAIRGLRESELKEHPTSWKNWDMWDFLSEITRSDSLKARILDVGCVGNPLLYNLATMGYKNLDGIDFDFPGGIALPHKRIKYTRGDLTRTDFPYQHFDVVTSLSVIEHGVDPEEYMREMSRILKPGGLLLTSTDYWPSKVSTRWVPKRKTFGLPWTIMTEAEIMEFVKAGGRWGLWPTARLDFTAKDMVVHWEGKQYTFFSFTLRKEGGQ